MRWPRGQRGVQGEVAHGTGDQTVPWDQLSNKGTELSLFFSLILFFYFEIVSIQRKAEENYKFFLQKQLRVSF